MCLPKRALGLREKLRPRAAAKDLGCIYPPRWSGCVLYIKFIVRRVFRRFFVVFFPLVYYCVGRYTDAGDENERLFEYYVTRIRVCTSGYSPPLPLTYICSATPCMCTRITSRVVRDRTASLRPLVRISDSSAPAPYIKINSDLQRIIFAYDSNLVQRRRPEKISTRESLR